MDVLAHIRELCEERGWSDYKLCKESGVPTTTISNMLHRNTLPTIPTLERICAGLGITVAEFFLPPETELRLLTREEIELLEQWSSLPEQRRSMTFELIKELNL